MVMCHNCGGTHWVLPTMLRSLVAATCDAPRVVAAIHRDVAANSGDDRSWICERCRMAIEHALFKRRRAMPRKATHG